MNIALIGYGKMGRTIEAMGVRQGHQFPVTIDEHNSALLHEGQLVGVDVAIEFTTPATAPENIISCINMGLPVVCGTTGWNKLIPEIEDYCREKNGTLFYASNFSIGVNILFALNQKLAEIMDQFPEYSASLTEVHHIHKKDAPSGTAITIAEQIIEVNRQISSWQLKVSEGEKEQNDTRLPIEAIREGEVMGKHSICYESKMDYISLTHNAFTREAFAAGVLPAASFIKDKKGVFGMQDLLKL